MPEIRGRFNPVKERLMTLISEADGALQPKATHISGNWKRPVTDFEHIPLVTVRCTPIDVDDAVYGRVFEEEAMVRKKGSITVFSWSAFIHTSACTDAGEQRGKHAQDLADRIIDHLINVSQEQSAYGIEDIFDVSYRESDVAKQPYALCRIIMTGRMLTKRYDA
jgi:hypothetical protein